jgi:hypothetical protein
MSGGIIGTLVLIYAGFTALLVASAVSIVRKAGYSAWWVCAGLVPLVNIVMLFAFAFSDWPALRVTRLGNVDAGRPGGHPGFSYAPAPPAEPAIAAAGTTTTAAGVPPLAPTEAPATAPAAACAAPAPAHTPPPRFTYREGAADGGASPSSGSTILPGH